MVDWSGVRCGCGGSAGHLGELLGELVEIDSPERMRMQDPAPHLIGDGAGAVPPVAPAAVGLMLAALDGGALLPLVRSLFLRLLAELAVAAPESAECRALLRAGVPVLLRAGLAGTAEDAIRAAEVCAAYWPSGDEPAFAAWVLLAERAERG
ncbi:hypothetical protein [Kitasatospora sp. NPDC088134]|uniref:hypothetical protein n=1 Tax=Kitasatospora sp. NPDC088134 TaxID=3364071 RepID=UPI0037FCF150